MRSALLSMVLLTSLAYADVVTLKDGSRREGRVVKADKEEVVLEVSQGRLKAQLIFKRSEVKNIEKGKTANQKTLEEIAARRSRLRANDAAGWLEFAGWLEGKSGFSRDARAAYRRVIAIDPENAEARGRLGYRKVGGQWMTEDELMAAKGFVKHRGQWMSPEEKVKAEAGERRKLADLRVALAEERRKELEARADSETEARRKWLKEMEDLFARKAAESRRAAYESMAVESGGVVLGRYGYGTYGVRTSTGQYIPYVPYGRPVYYYGPWAGPLYTTGRVTTSTIPQSYVKYHDKHWDVHFGGGGLQFKYTDD